MIIAFTGAGISQASGIVTFEEVPEIRDKLHRSYAQRYPEDYRKTIRDFAERLRDKEPNDAHRALAEYKIPVITMNIDGLHEKAGSQPLTLHGTLPSADEYDTADLLFNKPVLYGDMAPNYPKAIQKVMKLKQNDVLLVVGASRYTGIAIELREIAVHQGARVIEIQENAEKNVRETLERLMEQGVEVC